MASTCHELMASPNLGGDYHLTMYLLSLIPLLGMNWLTYGEGEYLAVSDAHVDTVICQCGLRKRTENGSKRSEKRFIDLH